MTKPKKDKIFLDSSVLVCAANSHSPDKQTVARGVLRRCARGNTGVISTQVLQEFYLAATQQFGFYPPTARELLLFFENMQVVRLSSGLVRRAVDVSFMENISFGQALSVVSARSADCAMLVTDDLDDRRIMVGIHIKNPFFG